jgi:hypothetical protein
MQIEDCQAPMEEAIFRKCHELAEMLVKKNRSYGNSAAEPAHIFSKASPLEQIDVRIDDKLKRIRDGEEFPGDNDVFDLAGYFILRLIVAEEQHNLAIKTAATNAAAMEKLFEASSPRKKVNKRKKN